VQHGRGMGDFIYQPCQPEPKMTVRAGAFSIALATIHAATNSCFGLFTGITVASATPAVVSMAVPQNLGGASWINIVPTAGPAGTRLSAEVKIMGERSPRLFEGVAAGLMCSAACENRESGLASGPRGPTKAW
jgi:hypothetical protein